MDSPWQQQQQAQSQQGGQSHVVQSTQHLPPRRQRSSLASQHALHSAPLFGAGAHGGDGQDPHEGSFSTGSNAQEQEVEGEWDPHEFASNAPRLDLAELEAHLELIRPEDLQVSDRWSWEGCCALPAFMALLQ